MQGTETNGKGDTYVGNLKYGFYQGHGMMIYKNGDKYSNDFIYFLIF